MEEQKMKAPSGGQKSYGFAIIAIKMLLKYFICRYETSINEVSEELERMRAKVAELLEENNRLPEAERMDVHEFELDVEEQQRRGTI